MSKNKTTRLVLGEGETIGHKHVLESSESFEFETSNDCIRIKIHSPGVLTHDEHDRIVLTPGNCFRSYNQVEFNPMDGSVSRVFD
jgi:hypothetical protein